MGGKLFHKLETLFISIGLSYSCQIGSLKPGKSPNLSTQEIKPVRVKFVLLNETTYPTTWKNNGEYAGMGGILFEDLTNPSDAAIETLSFALPLYSNLKFLPFKDLNLLINSGITCSCPIFGP